MGLDELAWDRWLKYRKAIRKTLKPASYEAAKKKLASFGKDQWDVVEQSIANGWQGLFELKGKQKPDRVAHPSHIAFADDELPMWRQRGFPNEAAFEQAKAASRQRMQDQMRAMGIIREVRH